MPPSRPQDWLPASQDILADQRAAYDAMRHQCPVAYSDLQGWTLFRHRDVVDVLHDPGTFSNSASRHLSVPNGMDPPEHTPFRRLIEPYFEAPAMQCFEPTCRAIAAELADGLQAGREVECMDAFARPFAARAQCAFLGWPESLAPAL
ncbi:cytochrome P450, partial [Aquisalimonas lutea]|nr:cytochrome P450 [Aquisalimonas lutea]